MVDKREKWVYYKVVIQTKGSILMSSCTHDCSSCKSDCASREKKTSFIKPLHEGAAVKKVIAVASGKGGVGKSLVTSLLAARANKFGYRTAVLDADITGPSIPKYFGITEIGRAHV